MVIDTRYLFCPRSLEKPRTEQNITEIVFALFSRFPAIEAVLAAPLDATVLEQIINVCSTARELISIRLINMTKIIRTTIYKTIQLP